MFISVALQPFVGPSSFYQFLNLYTVGRTPWTGNQLVARPLPTHTGQHKHRINAHIHPCFEWDSNPRSQCQRGEDSSCLRQCGHCGRHVEL
jgi:hypothetical protein